MDITYCMEMTVYFNGVGVEVYEELGDWLRECGYFLNLDMYNIDRLNFEIAIQFGTDDLSQETMALIEIIKKYPLTRDAKRININW